MSTDLKPEAMDAAFEKRFGAKIETIWNTVSQVHITRRVDERRLTEEQIGWIEGWDDRAVAE